MTPSVLLTTVINYSTGLRTTVSTTDQSKERLMGGGRYQEEIVSKLGTGGTVKRTARGKR